MRTRKVPECNYQSVFTRMGMTLRYKLDDDLPFKPLKNPDLLDVSLGTKCFGNCVKYCYTAATSKGINYPNVVEKMVRFFEPLNEHRPYQVAYGGGGEPTLHPEFCEVLKKTKELDIMPNYTTNGMHLSDKVLEYTAEYAGGVAVSTHKHLQWEKAVEKLLAKKIRTNIHVIVGEEGSFDYLRECSTKFPELETIVILPYQAQGFGLKINNEILVDEWTKCAKFVLQNQGFKYAFGALFYDFILKNPFLFKDVEIYEPEYFSGYLMLDDNPFIRISSYNLNPKTI